MCSKVKFGVLATALTLGGLWLLGAVTLGASKTNSLVACTWNGFKSNANNQVPVEVEIERIRHEINQLTPDMKNHVRYIAEETVQVRNLRTEVETIEANLGRKKEAMLAASKALESGTHPVVFEDRAYKQDQMRDKLSRELAVYKKNTAELKAKKDLLDAKERSLESAREQLAAMKDQKKELEIQVAKLEAEYKSLQVAQTKSKYQFDGSRLEAIKKSIEELQIRLDTESETLSLYEEFGGEGKPVQKTSNKDISVEVREYFNEGTNVNGKAVAERK